MGEPGHLPRGRGVIRAGLGAILGMVGLLWIGQGAGLIPGSFMTGQLLWLGLGIVCLSSAWP